MNSFVAKHRPEINGVLECFDRVILRGHLPIAGVGYFLRWLCWNQIALNVKARGGMVELQGRCSVVCRDIEGPRSTTGERAGRPYRHLPCAERWKRTLASWPGMTASPRVWCASMVRWKPAALSACSTTTPVPDCARTSASVWSSISTGWIANSA